MVKVPLPSNASTKRYHKTQAQNASTNGGGDASRVIYSIGLCKFAKIINISSGRRPIPRLS